ncbi:MAG: hypothetical protein C4589_11020 [Peptococcaceae bacterium]|nr:MAG: hypothetical protein C4589_11020 [Peptococcaceae bacterium]
MGNSKAIIGIDQLHYALLISDTVTGASWQAAAAVPGITEIGVNPNGVITTLFADNAPAIVANSIGEIEVSLKLADLTPVERAVLLGHTRAGGVTKYAGNDISPDAAIGFRTTLSDGTFGYVWLHKGKFAEAQETFTTKESKLAFQVPTLTGKFTVLAYNNEYKRTTRGDDPDYVAATGTNWFTSGPLGTTDTTPPIATSVPVDAAAGVAVDANIVITFDEAIQVSDVTAANFILMKADGTVIPGALSIDANHEIITFNPASNLSALTDHVFIVTTGVKDLAGNAMAAPLIVNFTTA